MPAVAPTPVDELSDAPDTSDTANFDSRADTHVEEVVLMVPQINSANSVTYQNALAAYSYAQVAAISAAAAGTTVNSDDVIGTSTTALDIGLGSKAVSTQTGKAWVSGMTLQLYNASGTMSGPVNSYTGSTLTLSVSQLTGSGSYASWNIFPTTIVSAYNPLWELKTGSFTATTGGLYLLDTSAAAFSVAAITAPGTGAWFRVRDAKQTADINLVTLARNGNTVAGIASDFDMNVRGFDITWTFDGASWRY